MYSPSTLNALWFAQPVLQLALAGAMVWRKLHRKFPVFFAYVIFQIAAFGILYYLYAYGHSAASYARYFYAYWFCGAISLGLGFKIIHEIFLDVFRPYHALKDLGSVLFKWAALVMMLVAIVVAATSSATAQGPVVEAVVTVQRCVRVIQVGLILFLLVFSNYVGISWKHYSFGVSLGFGFFAAEELLSVAMTASGRVSPDWSDLANVVGYNLCIMVWLGYALLKSPARENTNTLLKSQRWDHSLADLQDNTAPDSLIPMFENMVDRAFSRAAPPRSVMDIPSTPPDEPPPPKPESSKAQAG